MAELKDRYAAALFELSLERNMLKQHIQQADFVQKTLQSDQVESFLKHPHIPDTAKRELLQSLFANKISSELMGLLYLAIDKSREALIIPALAAYIETGNRHEGRLTANVVSARELSESQILALKSILSKKLNKQVEIHTKTDSDLIGGFYIYVDGRLIDRTIRTQLKNMKESLKRGGAG